MSVFDKLNAPDATTWKPAPDDVLVGRFVGVESRTTEYGSYPVVEVETDDGARVVFHAFHTVAKGQLAKARPKPGDTIGIKYLGRVRGGERSYESYRIVVDRPEGEPAPDWETMANEASAELGDALDDEEPF